MARRVIPLILLIALSALTPAALASEAGADGCAGDVDASDVRDQPTIISIPVASCEGRLDPDLDGRDFYGFEAVRGDVLQVFLDPLEKELATVCLLRPTGNDAIRCTFGTEIGDSLRYNIDEDGIWRLMLAPRLTDGSGAYRLTISVNEHTVSGSLLLGTTWLGVEPEGESLARRLGPSSEAPDGVWIDLRAPSDGRQTALLEYDRNRVRNYWADLDVRFYDETGDMLPQAECVTRRWNTDERCPVPAGATRALVEAYDGLDVEFTFRYYH